MARTRFQSLRATIEITEYLASSGLNRGPALTGASFAMMAFLNPAASVRPAALYPTFDGGTRWSSRRIDIMTIGFTGSETAALGSLFRAANG